MVNKVNKKKKNIIIPMKFNPAYLKYEPDLPLVNISKKKVSQNEFWKFLLILIAIAIGIGAKMFLLLSI